MSETKSFALDFDLPFPPKKVWRALTEPALMAKWIMPNNLKDAPKLGDSFQFKFDGPANEWWDGITHCEVQALELHKRIQYTWRGGPLDTVVEWTLFETPDGTRLHLVHSGFKPTDGHAQGGAEMGWKQKSKTLAKILGELS